ncbi:MAG: hypothetical protein M3Y08_20860 [Fibrobacterota bacterium]|nr:hypothetical protein [Fibrobacterota bacterium]
MKKSLLAYFAVALVLCLRLPYAQEVDQTSAPLGQFFDPENLDNINTLQSGASAAKDTKKGADRIKSGKYKDAATDAFSKYQNSKVGLMNIIRNYQKKAYKIINLVSARVDKWRTTVPKIRSYTQRTIQYADDSFNFAKTFEMSDLWDIDRNFSKEMEYRAKKGQVLGTSIYDFLVTRVESKPFLEGLENILFPDYTVKINKSALRGFHYTDAPSKMEKVPIFIINECLNTMGIVKAITESQLSPSPEAPALSKQQYDNKRIRDILFSPATGYTDQIALKQDIMNKQYEIATQRAILKDKIAYLELLWGQIAAQKIEQKELMTAASTREIAQLARLDLDPDTWVLEKFGLPEPTP